MVAETSVAVLSSQLEPGYLLAVLFVFVSWLAVSAWVVASRLLYDLRVAAVLRRWRPHRLFRRTAVRMAADASFDPRLVDSLVRRIISEDGSRMVRLAVERRGGIGQWRRAEALRVLARAGHPAAVKALERLLFEDQGEVAAAAATIVREIPGEEATSALLRQIQLEAFSPGWIATLLEGRTLPVALLRPLLRDPKPAVRAWAARLLAESGMQSESFEPELERLCRDADADVRAAGVEALSSAGDPAAAGQLADLLSDPVWYVQIHAARALGRLGSLDHALAIANLLADRKWWVRAAAKDALVALGPAVADDVIPLLEHTDRFVRNGAAEVLQNIGLIDWLLLDVSKGPKAKAAASSDLLHRILAAGGQRMALATLERLDAKIGDGVPRAIVHALGAA